MSSKEFTYWLAYDALEMPSMFRSDWNTARIVHAIYDVNSKRGCQESLSKLKLDFDTTIPEPDDDESMKHLLQWFKQSEGKIRKVS